MFTSNASLIGFEGSAGPTSTFRTYSFELSYVTLRIPGFISLNELPQGPE